MEDLQNKSATMKKLNTPSDDPIGAAKVLEMRSEKVNNDQFQLNGKMAESFLENSDHALSELADIVARAKEIAIGQSSGVSSSNETRLGVGEEVTQLFQQAVAVANRRVGDRYLFGGYRTERPPVNADGRFQGDDGQMMVEIAKDVFLSMNIPGIEAFNTNPKNSTDGNYTPHTHQLAGRAPASTAIELGSSEAVENVNVFDELQNLRIALLTGDSSGIHGTLERFDQLHSKLIATRSKVGSRMQGLNSTSQAIERHNITNAQLASSIEDADMAQVVTDLSREESVLKSALASSKNLIQPTLLDFLK